MSIVWLLAHSCPHIKLAELPASSLSIDQLSDWSKGAREARILLVLKLGRYVWLQVGTHKPSVMLLSIMGEELCSSCSGPYSSDGLHGHNS